ncbi:MAG TPA: MerR family transcriptional regulator [Frankiaceae bacterium]|nr:MerR family transcriptional regulator [Frankiaceae bacterium]
MDDVEPDDDAGAVYTATAVAARLGVAVETLRTWDRRYGVGPTGTASRGAGGRRRYREGDVARLLTMRRLVAAGVPTSDAARRAHAQAHSVSAEPATEVAGGTFQLGAGAWRGLLRTATALDANAVTALLTEAVSEVGVERTWNDLLRPALLELGIRWETTGDAVEVEHLLSQIASSVLRAVRTGNAELRGDQTGPSPVPPVVLLAAVDGEQHVLTLDALAALLIEHGDAVVSLGASTPASALDAVIRRLRPAAVFLWAPTVRPSVAEIAAALPAWPPISTRRPLRIVVGGEGFQGVDLPPGVRRVGGLAEARAALVDV